MKTFILSLLSALFLSCSSLSKKDCSSMNWKLKGITDARNNKNWNERLGDYQNQCKEHGISINRDAYVSGIKHEGARICSDFSNFHLEGWQGVGQRDAINGDSKNDYHNACLQYGVIPINSLYEIGYSKGIEVFCSSDSAYEFGLSGREYSYQCPKHLESNFLRHHTAGMKVFEAKAMEQEVATIENKLDSLSNQFSQKQREIDQAHQDLTHYLRSQNRKIDKLEGEQEYLARQINYRHHRNHDSGIKPIGKKSDDSLLQDKISVDRRLTAARSELRKKKAYYHDCIREYEDDLASIDRSIHNLESDLMGAKRELRNAHRDARMFQTENL